MKLNALKCLAVIILLSCISACSIITPITTKLVNPYIKIQFEASKMVNVDSSNRASPITVKILQLKDRVTFDNLNFERAYYQPELMLGDELLSIKKINMQPGEQRKLKIKLDEDVEFIAVIAGYMDINDDNWKRVFPVKDFWYYYRNVKLNKHGYISNKNER